MPGRKFKQANSSYRYGFNGQEKSDEIAEGLTTAMYWEYDSRTGRRWNLDPVPKIGESEYACFGNNPIYLSDPSGNQPDPPGKNNTKSYDYPGALRAACIHFLAARTAYFICVARAERKDYDWGLNNEYRQRAKSFSVTRYNDDNVATLGISQEAFTKEVSKYYLKFENAFNWSANETMKELKFIYYNKFDKARDIFKPNITVNQAYDGIHQTIAMLDDMEGATYTIAAKQEELFMKCAAITAAWACSSLGSGVAFSSVTAPGLQQAQVPSRTFPQMSGVPPLRAAYEAEVRGLSSTASEMRAAGKSSEEIATTLHGLRRELGVKYKSLTPENKLREIYQRNLLKYGDELGPSIEYLRQQGKSWDDIINSACRPGGKDLNF